MEHHIIVGTAGHVDHGKTALVKALTGTDTDRLPEEKRRGITIDLGFAAVALGDGVSAGIVDVPGHEDFVRNMVAGATGVDVALLVVAADEGVKPQTLEHLAILEFLAVEGGVLVLTKCDLAEDEWLTLLEDDVRERLAASSIDWRGFVRTSSVTGQGLDALQGALAEAAQAATARQEDDVFRLPVDRVFSVAGAGTVVTGTAWSGIVSVGDEVKIVPGAGRARVRGIEVHGEKTESARPGRRTALALAGAAREEIHRGHSVVTGDGWRETTAVDVLVSLLPAARPLTQRTRVRLHLGTAEVLARVTPSEREIVPGADGAARLRLEAPLACRWGDRGVLRSYSPVTTIGGCVVVDPFPAPRPRRPADLRTRACRETSARVAAFVEAAGREGLPAGDLPVRVGIAPQRLAEAVESAVRVTLVGARLFARADLSAARDAALRALEEYHTTNPLEPGMPRELARRAAKNESLADHVLEELAAEGLVLLEGQAVRMATYRPAPSQQQEAVGEALRRALAEAGVYGRTPAELNGQQPSGDVLPLLSFLVREGAAVRVGKDRYYDKGVLDKLVDQVIGEISRLGSATPAGLRDATGLSRKYLIPLLEWMDAQALTVRAGDARELGRSEKGRAKTIDKR